MDKMNQKIPVSVAIITKDEEVNIGDALESVKDFEDIVVVDSFSTDSTPEICRRYTDRFIQHEWLGYARQKQMAVDNTKKEWALILDADERVTPELKAEIITAINDTPYNGYYIPRKNYFLGKWIRHSGWWPDYTLRLFRKCVSHVEERAVHEKVVVKGATGHLRSPMEHFTYRSVPDFIKRMQVYAKLSAKEISARKSRSAYISVVINPLSTFFKMFFLRHGFMDGMHGYILAVLYSFYTFLKYLAFWGRRKNIFE